MSPRREKVGFGSIRGVVCVTLRRTLLDNTMLLYCSSMLTGNHEANQLPVVMLGGAAGRIKGGRVLDYEGKPEHQMCRL